MTHKVDASLCDLCQCTKFVYLTQNLRICVFRDGITQNLCFLVNKFAICASKFMSAQIYDL